MNKDTYFLRKSGREVYPFPWSSTKVPCPWPAGYMRVVIPMTEQEKRYSTKTCHIQIVRVSNIERRSPQA